MEIPVIARGSDMTRPTNPPEHAPGIQQAYRILTAVQGRPERLQITIMDAKLSDLCPPAGPSP